ncbi:hypothetical protein CTI12_AA403090 [Artemisia annua]|uniref:E3 ubiquitin-protein ligase Sina-like RING finger domain-containing protein n=1 Tax=Artemisia annua TaxID=35608 RepID=A0A2U1M9V6_ARTAN|nr:hypothetical protein CTI12_AA403090 [Artemisia annua]
MAKRMANKILVRLASVLQRLQTVVLRQRIRPYEDNQSSSSRETPTGRLVTGVMRDPSLINCRICLNPLSRPIYLCEDGHTAICSSCYMNLEAKQCPSSHLPLCRDPGNVMAAMIESIFVYCKNKRFGCNEIIRYDKQVKHAEMCSYTRPLTS